jgi:dinuclear metal center YbgI/SA1388 family protein
MKLSEILSVFESYAPESYQEKYDNAGLLTGNPDDGITGILLCLDVIPEVIDEALSLGANLIISHHPLVFHPLKNLVETDPVAKTVVSAVRNNIALYSAHTNLDNIYNGVNKKICEKTGLVNLNILSPRKGDLRKLVVFVPLSHADILREAILSAGAGKIGSYDFCSFNTEGIGTFRAPEGSDPYVGEIGKIHCENETRIETVFPANLTGKIIQAMLKVHPYEEAAYDIYPLNNEYPLAGAGMTGVTIEPVDAVAFLKTLKIVFNCGIIRHSALTGKKIRKVAVCGGAGSFLINEAINAGADIFITGDVRYHEFFRSGEKMIIADIGHYESEQFTIELFYDILQKKFPTFAIHFSKIKGNPINYF